MHGDLRRVARTVVSVLNAPVARARFRRAVEGASRPIALELGGKRPRDGWLVTDVGPRARRYLDASRPWPFADGELSYVYADNVIEHIPLPGARVLFAEAHRCLGPGGVMRLVVPDVRRHVELYLQGVGAVDSDVAKRYRSIGVLVEHPVDLVRTAIGEFGHHEGYAWDLDALRAELGAAGFEQVRECEVGASEHPALVDLEQRQEAGQAQLVVEATR